MEQLTTVVTWLERVAQLLGFAAVPALVVAIAAQWRGTVTAMPRGPGPRLAMVAVGGTFAVGVAAALVTDVPLGIGGVGMVAIVLTSVLMRERRSFWVVFASLMLVISVAGALQLVSLSHNVVSSSGAGQFGGRQLVAFGGINANPVRPGWEWTIVALSTLGFGIPLGFALTTSWAGATGGLGRAARLALLLAGGSVGVAVLGSTVLHLFVSINAAVLGLPLVLAIPSVVAGVLLLLLVGPGQIAALVAPARLVVVRGYHAARDVLATAETTIATTRLPPPSADELARGRPLHGFVAWLRGSWSWQHRLSAELLITLLVVSVAGEAAAVIATGEQRTLVTVSYEPIARELAVGFPVVESVALEDTIWLRGAGGEVARFDGATSELTVLDTEAASIAAAPTGGVLLALTAEDPPRLLSLSAGEDAAGARTVLDQGFAGDLAVHGGLAWVLAPDGRLGAWALDSGRQVRGADGPPGRSLQVGASGVWTEHPASPTVGAAASVRHLRRDPVDLEVLLDTDTTLLHTAHVTDLDVPDTGAPWVATGTRIARIDPATGELYGGRPHAAVPTIGEDAAETRLTDLSDGAPTAVTVPRGVVSSAAPSPVAVSFHYDTIEAVHRLTSGTWLVVTNDRGTLIGVETDGASMLALWDRP